MLFEIAFATNEPHEVTVPGLMEMLVNVNFVLVALSFICGLGFVLLMLLSLRNSVAIKELRDCAEQVRRKKSKQFVQRSVTSRK